MWKKQSATQSGCRKTFCWINIIWSEKGPAQGGSPSLLIHNTREDNEYGHQRREETPMAASVQETRGNHSSDDKFPPDTGHRNFRPKRHKCSHGRRKLITVLSDARMCRLHIHFYETSCLRFQDRIYHTQHQQLSPKRSSIWTKLHGVITERQ
jgi:hypothetical protein